MTRFSSFDVPKNMCARNMSGTLLHMQSGCCPCKPRHTLLSALLASSCKGRDILTSHIAHDHLGLTFIVRNTVNYAHSEATGKEEGGF